MKTGNRQSGFSLIELMVAMLLGMLITAAAVALFSTNQRTFQLQQARSQIQEQGQLAMRFLAGDVRLAGFNDPDTTSPINTAILTTAADGLPGSSDGDTGSDRITISYDGSVDCEGNSIVTAPATTRIVNTYWVDSEGDLMCQGNQAVPLTNGVRLLSGVRSFQVLYGVDLNQDGVPFAARYVTADDISGKVVLGVKLSLLLKRTVHSLGSGNDTTWYVLDQTVAVDPTDTLVGQFSTSVALRNYPWEEI